MRTGEWGWEHGEESMGTGAWGWERGDGIVEMGAWGHEHGMGSFFTIHFETKRFLSHQMISFFTLE